MLNKRVIFILFLLIMAIGAISAVNANDLDNATSDMMMGIDENNIDDLSVGEEDINEMPDVENEEISKFNTEEVLSADEGSFTELQNQINKASSGSKISLNKDYSYNIGFENKHGIKISKSLTIEGNGHVIDGLMFYRIFEISGAKKVVFNNVVFRNGYTTKDDGGAIYASKSSIYINNCVFEGNQAIDGGHIYVSQSNLTCKGSFFTRGQSSYGGSVCSVNSNLNFADTTFDLNYGELAGGNIYSLNGVVTLSNSSFSNSLSSGTGGSACFINSAVEMNKCIFDNCLSYGEDGGGGVYCLNSKFKSVSSQFKTCNATFGGAICCLNTDLEIRNNTFYNNLAIYYGGSIYSIYGSVSVETSTFSYSQSALYGGSMYIRSPNKIVKINNNKFLYSSALLGPRIYVDSYNAEIPQSGNIYEDVYFAVALFNGTEDEEYSKYSNILTYVISNSNNYQNDLNYYANMRDVFASSMGFADSPEVNVSIFDEGCPDSQIIFLNYDNLGQHTLVYDSVHGVDKLVQRDLDIDFYNLKGTRLNYFHIMSFYDVDRIFQYSDRYYNVCFFNDYSESSWNSHPIIDDESRLIIKNSKNLIYSLTEEEFYQNRINGKFNFYFGDTRLVSNFGNVYELGSFFTGVPLISSYSFNNDLPSYYDSRDYGYVTPVKDQSIGGNCWAFAGIATLEACLKKITGQTYDFSEDNAKNLMAMSSIYGLNLDPNGGGYDTMFMGYLTSWLGPIDNVHDEYNPIGSLSVVGPSMFHIQDILFLPARQSSYDNDVYKSAIMDYGAISVILDWTENGISSGLHAVSLVGWDDDYIGYDSLGNYANGVWIFKNSWGSDWEDDGFGYLSYEQELSEQIASFMHAYTFIFNDDDIAYQNIYQYDFAGLTEYLIEERDYVYYKNKFTASRDEFLYAFSTYFEKDTKFTFSVRINGKDINMADGNVPIENSIHSATAGYHTIPLGYNLTLKKGDEFEIIIKLLNPEENYIPICQADDLYRLSYPKNVSFYSRNGKDWIDLYNLNSNALFEYGGTRTNTCQVACIKAFTATWRFNSTEYPYIETLSEDSITFRHDIVMSQDYIICDLNVYPLKDSDSIGFFVVGLSDTQESFENYIKVDINGEITYLKLDGHMAFMDFDFSEDGFYKGSAIIQSNEFSSRLVEFNFVGGDESNYGNFTELQEMIYNAKKGSTLYLDKHYYADVDYKNNYSFVEIDKSLTIDGRGHTLNGMSQSSIFLINHDCNVTLKNIRFEQGNSGDFGAIGSYGNLRILNCSFEDNEGHWGGTIYSNGPCYIEKSTFDYNYGYYGGAICCEAECSIVNSIFELNIADNGGAIYSRGDCSIIGSTFEFNVANFGGAIDAFGNINISNSKFEDNEADTGGAIDLCNVSSCNLRGLMFYYNSAMYGGAIFSLNSAGHIYDSIFDENDASRYGGAIYSEGGSGLKITNSNFTDNYAEEYGGTIVSLSSLNVTGSSFKSDKDVEIIYYGNQDDNKTKADLYLKNNKIVTKGIGIMYDDEKPYGDRLNLVFNNVKVLKGEYANLCQITDEDGNTIRLSEVNVILTDKNNPSKTNKLKIKYNSTFGGYALDTSAIDFGTYQLSGSISGDFTVKSGMLNVVSKSVIMSSGLTKAYGTSNKLSVTLKDSSGKAISGAYVYVKLNGKTTKIKTNSKGVATLSVSLVPKKYTATISYAGNDKYSSANTTAKVVIKKATPKITASKKTFKAKTKTKKYTITLKVNNKVMKSTKVTIKVGGKTYSAKTNSKGKATFKITKLTKKGTFKATITYAGSRYYNKATKSVMLTVKK